MSWSGFAPVVPAGSPAGGPSPRARCANYAALNSASSILKSYSPRNSPVGTPVRPVGGLPRCPEAFPPGALHPLYRTTGSQYGNGPDVLDKRLLSASQARPRPNGAYPGLPSEDSRLGAAEHRAERAAAHRDRVLEQKKQHLARVEAHLLAVQRKKARLAREKEEARKQAIEEQQLATAMQAMFRGHRVRAKIQRSRDVAAQAIQTVWLKRKAHQLALEAHAKALRREQLDVAARRVWGFLVDRRACRAAREELRRRRGVQARQRAAYELQLQNKCAARLQGFWLFHHRRWMRIQMRRREEEAVAAAAAAQAAAEASGNVRGSGGGSGAGSGAALGAGRPPRNRRRSQNRKGSMDY